MKEKLRNILPYLPGVIACVLLAVCLYRIAELENRVQYLQSDTQNRIASMENTISGIYANVNRQLEEQANLLSGSDWEYGEADLKEGTVPVTCSVVPKEYSPQETAATLICNEKEYPMTLVNGTYTVTLPVSLFEESRINRVRFDENGKIRVQELDDPISPRYDHLPIVYARYHGGSTGRPDKGVYNLTYNGQISIEMERKGEPVATRSLTLIAHVNGEEILREDVPLNTEPITIHEGNTSSTVAVPDYAGGSPTNFFYAMDKTISIPFGGHYELYIEAVDGLGLTHKALVDAEAISEDGKPEGDKIWWRGAEGSLYAPDGTLLYGVDLEKEAAQNWAGVYEIG